MATVKKAQVGKKIGVKATPDSTSYYQNRLLNINAANRRGTLGSAGEKMAEKTISDLKRQSKKGKPGYNADGFPVKKAQTGRSVKRDEPVSRERMRIRDLEQSGPVYGTSAKKAGKIAGSMVKKKPATRMKKGGSVKKKK